MHTDKPSELTIEFVPNGKAGMGAATVKHNDAVITVDRINILNEKARARFSQKLADSLSGLPARDIQAALLEEAARVLAQMGKTRPSGRDIEELDVSKIVRPELFHRSEVSGIAVPVPFLEGGKPQARWELCLRWHRSSRREQRQLSPLIPLPNGEQLIVFPTPSAPSPHWQSTWSVRGRRDWLNGKPTPNAPAVFNRICEIIGHYLDLGRGSPVGTGATLALWTMFTYVFPVWPAVPYLSINGPLGSGKSRVLEVLAPLVFRPIRSANLTASSLFRSLHETGGVLLLDEAERLRDKTPDAMELRSILLSGYKAGAPARRNEPTGDGGFRQVDFDVFGPKAIAGIAQLPEALISRCIRITMFRSAPDCSKPRRRLQNRIAEMTAIRDDLHALALEHGDVWAELSQRTHVCPEMSGRDFELWQPLLALAEWLEEQGEQDSTSYSSGLLEIMQNHALECIEMASELTTPEPDEILLRLLAKAVYAGVQRHLQPQTLLQQARLEDEELFRRYSAKGVATALNRYGIKTSKTDGKRTYNRITPSDIRQVERSYGLASGVSQETCHDEPDVPSAKPPAVASSV